MKSFNRALLIFFTVACAGVALVSVSRLRIGDGYHDLLTIGSGVFGVVLLVIAAQIYRAALTARKTN